MPLGYANCHSVFGCVVLIFILGYQAFLGIIISFILLLSSKFHLVSLEVGQLQQTPPRGRETHVRSLPQTCRPSTVGQGEGGSGWGRRLGEYRFRFYIQVYNPFSVSFCVWCKIKVDINLFYFTHKSSTICWKDFPPPIDCIEPLSRINCPYIYEDPVLESCDLHSYLFTNTKLFWPLY